VASDFGPIRGPGVDQAKLAGTPQVAGPSDASADASPPDFALLEQLRAANAAAMSQFLTTIYEAARRRFGSIGQSKFVTVKESKSA
jgi:hypothetical protein